MKKTRASAQPDRVAMPVDDVIEDALAALRTALGEHRVAVFIRHDLPLVSVDPVQVGLALQHVLLNAAKFSPPRSEIRIAASHWRGAIDVRIADQGSGIPVAEREAVFEEVYRSDDRRVAGSGLLVAKEIVLAHGGQIWVEDTPGGGTTIVVRLPAVEHA